MSYFNRPSLLVFQSETQRELAHCLNPKIIRDLCRVEIIKARFLAVVVDVVSGEVHNSSMKTPSFQSLILPRGQCSAQSYRKLAEDSAAQFFLFFNWHNPIIGFDSRTRFCSRNVFEIRIKEDMESHFVLMRFVRGRTFFKVALPKEKTLLKRLQLDLSRAMNLVIQRKITWDSKSHESLQVPEDFDLKSTDKEEQVRETMQ